MSVDSRKRYRSIRGKLTGIGGTSSGVWVYARNISVCLEIRSHPAKSEQFTDKGRAGRSRELTDGE